MRWWWPAVLPALALLWTGGGLAAQSAAGGDGGGARALILRALERAAWHEEQNVAARYRARMTKEVRRFDRNGGVRTRDVGEYEVAPIDGVPFERRLTVGDRPLNEAERSREDQREAAFREALRQSAEADGSDDSEEDDVVFNEELVARYVFTLEEEERFRNRPSYRIAFEPRPGRLPVRRRIDYALNKARGRVWIDRDTYEPARVEFELIDRVRLWWGMLGTIRHARGSLDRGPVLGGVWARIQFEIYSDVRVVFRHTRRAEFRSWRDFEFVAEADGRPPPAP